MIYVAMPTGSLGSRVVRFLSMALCIMLIRLFLQVYTYMYLYINICPIIYVGKMHTCILLFKDEILETSSVESLKVS